MVVVIGELSDGRLDEGSEFWLDPVSTPLLEDEDVAGVITSTVPRLVVLGEFSDI